MDESKGWALRCNALLSEVGVRKIVGCTDELTSLIDGVRCSGFRYRCGDENVAGI